MIINRSLAPCFAGNMNYDRNVCYLTYLHAYACAFAYILYRHISVCSQLFYFISSVRHTCVDIIGSIGQVVFSRETRVVMSPSVL